MEGPLGFEPRTHSLKGCRSNQLSYGPTSEVTSITPPPASCTTYLLPFQINNQLCIAHSL
ncbi:MAG: hypothetical protein QG658_292 [Patescibacteria group bacterium]|nr:hypothetical protein [Patescibacteria group bacterium]